MVEGAGSELRVRGRRIQAPAKLSRKAPRKARLPSAPLRVDRKCLSRDRDGPFWRFDMPRIVRSGLIQCANAKAEGSVKEIQEAMFEKHIPLLEEAARRGVQILCLQEIFNGPYFCPAQTPDWYDAAEAVPGPTTERLQKFARQHQMVLVVPIYEREMAGVYYNTAAVIDADGTYLGKYRKNHIPQTAGFWEKYYFKPGNLGYPVFKTRYATVGVYICY